MDKGTLILIGILAFVFLIIAVMVIKTKSDKSMANIALANNALAYKTAQEQGKTSAKDIFGFVGSLAGSAATIYGASQKS